MENSPKSNPSHPILLAALVGAGAGMLTGVLLASGPGAVLRRNVRKSAHKYALLASEQEQILHHHLTQQTTRLEAAGTHLMRDCHSYLQLWGLLPQDPRRPY